MEIENINLSGHKQVETRDATLFVHPKPFIDLISTVVNTCEVWSRKVMERHRRSRKFTGGHRWSRVVKSGQEWSKAAKAPTPARASRGINSVQRCQKRPEASTASRGVKSVQRCQLRPELSMMARDVHDGP